MKRKVIYLCSLALLFTFAFSACGTGQIPGSTDTGSTYHSGTVPNNSGNNADSTSSGLPETGAGDYEGEAQLTENYADEKITADTSFEGIVKFEKDSSSKVSLQYDTDSSNEQQVRLETPDGLVWDLIIPAHALLEDATITMTSLKNVESPSIGSIKAGVLLEPDGLQFYKPATLTLSGNAGSNPLLLSGNHDGSKTGLALVEKTNGGVSARLLHFSSIYDYPLDDEHKMTQLREKAAGNYEEIRQIALDFLKTPIRTPAPKPMSLRCPADHKPMYEDELRQFLAVFYHPEGEIAQELLAAARTVALLNGGDTPEEATDICMRLAKRLLKKAYKLSNTYYPQEEYLLPIGTAALSVERDYQLLGGPDDRSTINMIGDWVNKVAQQFLDDLRDKHDYKAAKPALRLGREAVLFGTGSDNILQEVQDALNFEVRFECEVTLEGTEGNLTYKTSGKAPHIIQLVQLENPFSKGQGKYDSFTSPEPRLSLKLPNSFKFLTTVENFNPCLDKPFDIYIDRFGAKTETMVAAGYPSKSNGVVESMITLFMKDESVLKVYDIESGSGASFHKFSVQLQNRNVTAAEKTFTKSMNGVSANVTVRLVHTPK